MRHLVIQLDAPLVPAKRTELESSGLRLLSYLGSFAFFAAVVPEQLDAGAIAENESVVDARPIIRSWKTHPLLAAGTIPTWAWAAPLRRMGEEQTSALGFYVVFHRDVPAESEGPGVAGRHGGRVRAVVRSVNALVVELPWPEVAALADEDAVQWIEPALPRMSGINDSNRVRTGADTVQAPPYDLDGSGVTVLVYDAATARASHLDFGGRLTVRDASGTRNHPTHVACTVGGGGQASGGQYAGMAPGVMLESYGFEYDGSGIFLYTNPGDIEADYDEAINVHGADVANNSIGTNTCWNGFPCSITGDYCVTSALIDAIVGGSLGEPFRVVWANGNERSCPYCPGEHQGGYHSTAPPACAKNHITVGALNSDDDSQTSFTSWGPADDGRIKPDIAAPGCQDSDDFGVKSCSASSDTAYTAMCGTSMAAPTVTGLAALLLQDFRTLYTTSPDFRNSTLKALLAHTAQDLPPAGPDYSAGYGSVRIQAAVDLMRSRNFVEGQVAQAQTQSLAVRVRPGDSELKVTLSWDDFPGTPNVRPALVNDLDLRVQDPDGIVHFPWTLDPANPSAPAVRALPDHTNNIEQVLVDAPSPGAWLVEVIAFDVPEGPQTFSLCASPYLVHDCNGNGTPDDEEIQADPSLDCGANGVLDACEPDCDGDGAADSCEIIQGTSADCNQNGIPDDCESPADCNANGVPDICDLAAGTSTDCNRNAIPDECDVASGLSDDCNANTLPDECEPDKDCNDNGIRDICDIGAGTSPDCNANSVPDECDIFSCGPPIGRCPQPGDCCDLDGHSTPGCACARCCHAVCQYDSYCCQVEWDSSCAFHALSDPNCNCPGGAFPGSPDCNGNQVPDECDLADGTSADCNANGVPDECDPNHDCNGNGTQDICDVASGTSPDCNHNEVPDECDPQDDCNLNGVQDICDVAGGASTDCNDNAIPDECDLSSGFSGDCNANEVPDECDPIEDCNGNGVLDFCDLALGTSPDCNSNARPDECDIYVCGPPVGSCPGTGDCCDLSGKPTPGCDCARCCASVCSIAWWCCAGPWSWLCASLAAYQADCDCGGPGQEWSEDCNGNAVPDECDIGAGASADCNSNAVPDECDPNLDCNLNGVQDICDVAAGTSSDCDADEVPDECGPDCNGNGVPDECDIIYGTSEDCNSNHVPDECDPFNDCNANGIQDICDVASSTSKDCNGNGVPDECEVDCNSNGVPDTCDISPPDTYAADICAKANPACSGLVYYATTFKATNDGSASCGLSSGSPDIWYRYEARQDGDLLISLCESAYDTVLSVHTACPADAGNELACNDDASCFPMSEILLHVEAGTTYWIRIAGFSGSVGGVGMRLIGPGAPSDCDATSADCNFNLIPDECDLASGAATDCQPNGVPDECDVPPLDPQAPDCNANGIPDACELDCQANGIPDSCDIASAASSDCNTNEVPDECDLLSGISNDCNINNIPDECDIFYCGPPAGPCPGLGDCCAQHAATGCDCARCCRAVCQVYTRCCTAEWDFLCTMLAATLPDCDCGGENQHWSHDCNANGAPDECDLRDGNSADCNSNDTPDECEPDADGDGAIDDCDGCPYDAAKNVPGYCGCGTPETDTDGDGVPDCADHDDDNDGVPDQTDSNVLDPAVCADADGDGCDDCTVGTDRFGPLPDNDPMNDGPDSDGDGRCDPPPVPAASSWGAVILTLLLLAMSKVLFRRRPVATARAGRGGVAFWRR